MQTDALCHMALGLGGEKRAEGRGGSGGPEDEESVAVLNKSSPWHSAVSLSTGPGT